MTLPGNIDFNSLKPEEFEHILPDLFAGSSGKLSQDPRLQKFLAANPDCATLVRDLEIIAETARSLFHPVADPSDRVWENIQAKLQEDSSLDSMDDDIDPAKNID